MLAGRNRRKDHPRSRGEYCRESAAFAGEQGSSPLSRGIQRRPPPAPTCPRIIPALAGNTSVVSATLPGQWDHPRSRGEYFCLMRSKASRAGSSPLSRGIPTSCVGAQLGRRIIPALAGNTRARSLTLTVLPDHPRSRGEYETSPVPRPGPPGSSPLSRGIRRIQYFPDPEDGIIPALAGNTLADKGFYQLDLSDLGNPLLARLRFSKSLAPRLRRPPSWRGESSGSSPEGPGRTIRVSPS